MYLVAFPLALAALVSSLPVPAGNRIADGDLPQIQANANRDPAGTLLISGPAEAGDFELTPTSKEDLRLEVRTRTSGWHVAVAVRVRGS